MAMCMVFVFGSLLEFAIVNVLSRSKKTKEKDSEKEKQKEPTSNCPEKVSFKFHRFFTYLLYLPFIFILWPIKIQYMLK